MHKTTWTACGALALVMLVGGCGPDRLTVDDIRKNPTPELESMALTNWQRKNREARVNDTNMRQIWDDLDQIFLTDRPSRMTRYPVP